jgi:heptosyltransferase-2
MKIAIFLPNWLGDLVMATPALRAVRKHFGPHAKLVGIMRPYLADVLAGTNWLDEQWYFHPKARDPALRPWALVRRMRHERFDIALLMPNSLRAAVLARLGGARERIGYCRYGRGPLLTQKLASPRAHGCLAEYPMVDYYLRLAEAVGSPPESRRLELATLEKDERAADAVWADLGLRTDGQVVTLNSGSSNGAARFWPSEYFGELARRLADEQDHDVLVMCGPKERAIAREVVRFANHSRVFSMADQPLDLGTAKACIRRSRLMISTDSGPRHVAAAFGKPVVTLRGPTLPIWSENPTVVAIDLRLDLECIGCQNRICPLGHHKCMRDLTPDMVYAEVVSFFKNKRRTACAA